MDPLTVGLIIGGVVVLSIILIYNSLIRKRNEVENAFASIDVMLRKRYDLIPQLVETVKGYMTHEQEALTKLTELRSQVTSGDISSDQKVNIDNQISKQMGGIMIAVEAYPDLKASTNFLQLQGSMNEVEEQISASRRFFNSAVTDYNNAIQVFPTNMFAGMMGMTRRQLFEISVEIRDGGPPKVNL